MISDTPIITKTLQSFLTDLGYEVTTVNFFEREGLSDKISNSIDVVIISHGAYATIIRNIRKQNSEARIVIIKGNGGTLTTREALAYGVYAYLHKPINLQELELLLIRLAENLVRSSPKKS
jgi:DNA-binding response OmpR family regulator